MDRILIYYHYDLLDNDIDLDQHEHPEHAKIIAKPLHPNIFYFSFQLGKTIVMWINNNAIRF